MARAHEVRNGASGANKSGDCLQKDLLHGAEAIAEFVFGDAKKRRRIYQLAESSPLPVFRLGATLCARKSKLLAWIAQQEGAQPSRK